MLLKDGVRYELWTPPTEDEFEKVVSQHAQEIFGKDAKYFDLKHKLASKAGTGSIPDGYVITLENTPQVQIIELELASHTLQHIVTQIVNIIGGIENPATQRKICNAIEDEINQDEIFVTKIAKAIKPIAIHRFLSDSLSMRPIINVIIDKSSTVLEEAVNKIAYSPRIVEFQTFTRERVGLEVHAHLFEPVCVPVSPPPQVTPSVKGEKVRGRKVTFEELANAGLLKDEQVLYFYHTQPFKDERAQVIAPSNELKYEVDGRTYSKSELAKILLIKHGFKHDEHGVAGPKYWKTEDGKSLIDLEEQVRRLRGDRGE